MNIGDLCRRQVVTCSPQATLCAVARLMRQHHVGSIVVCDDVRKPVGMLTDRDIVVEAVAPELDPGTVTAGHIMSGNPSTVLEDVDVSWALKMMRDQGIRRLPVVGPAGKLVGIIALDDLLSSAATSLADVVQAIGTERVIEADRRPALA